ncbi:hypothetical protein O5190_27240, partial [Escherichia coli]|nr:hypothetical protein [Escherichia coli]
VQPDRCALSGNYRLESNPVNRMARVAGLLGQGGLYVVSEYVDGLPWSQVTKGENKSTPSAGNMLQQDFIGVTYTSEQ